MSHGEMKLPPFLELLQLKDLPREGWVIRGIERPESVADHSWGTALLVLRYGPEAGINLERALSLALVHDLTEVRVGDIPRRADPRVPRVDEGEKREREESAARALALELSWPEFETLWREYDRGGTEEAEFVRDMNLIEMVLQATLYASEQRWDEEEGRGSFPSFSGLDEFFETSRSRVRGEFARSLYGRVEAYYRSLRDGVADV